MPGRLRVLAIVALLATLGLASATPGSPAGPQAVRAAGSVELCGKVAVYVKATAILPGAVTIGAIPFVIRAGVAVPAAVQAGATVCVRLTVNLAGEVTEIVALDARASSTLKVCAGVAAYAKATVAETGSLKIGRYTLAIAHGVSLPAAVKVGADLCAVLTLNAFGQVKGGDVIVNATSTVKVCGVVSAYARATATATGLLKVDGHSFIVASNATLPAALKVGADLCVTLVLNAFGQVQDGAAKANVLATLDVCGKVTAYEAATASAGGHIAIGSVSKRIWPGTTAASSVKIRAYLDLRLGVNVFGQVAKVTVLKVGATLAAACGGPVPAPTPTPTPTATPTPSATPTPTPSATPTPTPTPDPTPTPTPAPVPNGTPTPSATPTPAATPTPTPAPSPTGSVGGLEQCNPDMAGGGAGNGGNGPTAGGQAPVLPDTSTVGRAAQVVGTAAIPFGVFLLGLLAGQLITRKHRDEQRLVPLLAPDAAGSDQQ